MTDVTCYSFHLSYAETMELLDDEQLVSLIKTMNNYAFHGIENEIDDALVKVAWTNIKPNIEASIKRSKTNSNNRRKNGRKTTVTTDEETTDLPDSYKKGAERSGAEKNFLSHGKKESSSDSVGDADADKSAPPPLPKGWERTGTVCTPGRCISLKVRDPDGNLWCPQCDKADLRLMGVIS